MVVTNTIFTSFSLSVTHEFDRTILMNIWLNAHHCPNSLFTCSCSRRWQHVIWHAKLVRWCSLPTSSAMTIIFHKHWAVKKKIAVRCTRAHARACGVPPVCRGLLVYQRAPSGQCMHHKLLLSFCRYSQFTWCVLTLVAYVLSTLLQPQCNISVWVVMSVNSCQEFLTEMCIRDSSLFPSVGVNNNDDLEVRPEKGRSDNNNNNNE